MSSEAGGEATAAEEEQRAEERVCSPGGTRQAAQQDTQSTNTHRVQRHTVVTGLGPTFPALLILRNFVGAAAVFTL